MARPTLLHDDRGDPGVMGPGVEQGLDGVGQDLAGGVVEVGLEQHDRLPRELGSRPGTPPPPPGCNWAARRSRVPPRRSRSTSMRMGGRGPKLDAMAATMAAPVGVVSSTATSRPHVGMPAQQPDHRRRGVGQEPVGAADRAHAGRHGRRGHLVDTEDLQRGGRADHVDHGVVRPHLVEVDLLGGPAMEPPLDLGQRGERGQSPPGHPRRAGGPLRRGPRCGRGSAPRRRRSVSTTARVAAIPARSTGSARRVQPPRGRRCRSASTSEKSAPASRRLPSAMSPAMPAKQWNQATVVGWSGRATSRAARSTRHVVGSQPGAHGSIRATAQAAPKPLSIPTTVRPAAHDACMASRAVIPSRAAP